MRKLCPLDALPSRVRRYVEAVASATATDPSFAGLGALVLCAGAIGNRVAAQVKRGWVEPAVLWGALVARSGQTKSPVLRLLTRPLVEIQKRDHSAQLDAAQAFEAENARYQVRLAEWKDATRNGEVRDPPLPPDRPQPKRTLVADVTCEKLADLLSSNPLGLLVVRDELSGWIGSFDRYAAGGKGADLPTWLSMFDAGPVQVDRKTSGSIFVERAAVSVLGTVQPRTLARVFGAAERESGLLARLLLCFPPERASRWVEAELPDEVARDWGDLVRELLALEPPRDDAGDPRPRLLPLDDAGKRAYRAWHDSHVAATAALDDDDLQSHYAKLKGGAIRLALVLAVVEAVSGGGSRAAIGGRDVERAIELVEWLKIEAARVYGELAESGDVRKRRKAVAIIAAAGGSVSVRDWQRRRHHETAAIAEHELRELVKLGYGRMEAVRPEGRGRPGYVFVLDPPCDKNTNFELENRIVSLSHSEAVPAAVFDDYPEAHSAPPESEEIDPW